MTAVISNASPLIGLCKIDLLYVLKELWREVTISEAVYREVVVDGKGKPGSNVIENACKDWIKVVAVKNRHEVEALQAILDKGESEVIALGQELKADLLLLGIGGHPCNSIFHYRRRRSWKDRDQPTELWMVG